MTKKGSGMAPGRLVPVNDTFIHVFRVPAAAPLPLGRVVFLAGSGTECPTYDFKPLWRLLTDDFEVAVVERLGYGWSGPTALPRDVDTVLEETREALRLAGLAGPYIPTPHSLAGLEALYWAQKYPGEVAAIVGLDMAVPQVYDAVELPRSLALQVRLAHLLRRPLAGAMVKRHPAVTGGLLTETEQAEMRRVTAAQMMSKNMVEELDFVRENAPCCAVSPATGRI